MWTIERKLLVLTGRLTFSQDNEENIKNILQNEKVNWYEFLKLIGYHKCISLSVNNIKKIYPSVHFPKYFNDFVNYLTYCTAIRNQKNQFQVTEIIEKCA